MLPPLLVSHSSILRWTASSRRTSSAIFVTGLVPPHYQPPPTSRRRFLSSSSSSSSSSLSAYFFQTASSSISTNTNRWRRPLPLPQIQRQGFSSSSSSIPLCSVAPKRVDTATNTNVAAIQPSQVITTTTNKNNKNSNNNNIDTRVLNLSTITKSALEDLVVHLGHPKFRANQVWHWIRQQGVTDVTQMHNVPLTLRQQLQQYTKSNALEIALELKSKKDGTIKRAYKCADGQVIESVLMPYDDGRYTACISSQAGCAQGCVFCATGQMGFVRSLTADEIFEQVARFASELQQEEKQQQKQQKQVKANSKNPAQQGSTSSTTVDNNNNNNNNKSHGKSTRLSNIVFMGMGEPLANLRNVKQAIRRIHDELGIGARRITISTVGIVPNIRRLFINKNNNENENDDEDKLPNGVRLAVSLHCATDEERNALLPVNKRYGGLDGLMTCLQDYMTATGQRLTLEWALIEGQNDTVETAQSLGRLIARYLTRRDQVHVNVIPLNPTGQYGGQPSSRDRVQAFCHTLQQEFGIACTPRVRRGIDIQAGCGQLKAQVVAVRGNDNDATSRRLLHPMEPHNNNKSFAESNQDNGERQQRPQRQPTGLK
ncbi:hypothetical protein ACA910_021343 [Epithemia clementina (nom. ined.)]